MKTLLWIHEDSYEEACEEFAASFDSPNGQIVYDKADEVWFRADLAARRARISELRCEIAAL